MARPFNHHLTTLIPGHRGQFAKRFEFGELRAIIGVGNRSRSQTIAQRKTDVIGRADIADLLEVFVQKAFGMMMQTPLGHD